jgi:hypothetical protein
VGLGRCSQGHHPGLTPTDSTNYDDALNEAIKAFGDTGKLANAQNVSYFMSDGLPNANSLSGTPPQFLMATTRLAVETGSMVTARH